MNTQATAIETKEKVTSIAPAQQEPISLVERLMEKAELTTENLGILKQFLEIQNEQEARQAERSFNKALSAAQGEIPIILTNSVNSHTKKKYDDLAAINPIVMPILKKYGLSITFIEFPAKKEKHLGLGCTLSHEGGHSKDYAKELPIDTAGSKNSIQAYGSTSTYARRYLLKEILNLASSDDAFDDDGQGACEGFITLAQVDEVRELLKKTGASEQSFVNYMKVGDLSQIPASKFEDAKKTISNRVQTNG